MQKGFVEMKNTGFGRLHFTLSVWESESDAGNFARSGAHLEAMWESGKLATEIRIYTFQAEQMPDWQKAKRILLEKGRLMRFGRQSSRNSIIKNLQNERDRAEIIRRLQTITNNTPGFWGKMTANQMICHLSDAFRGVTGEIKVAPTGTLSQRVVLKRMMLYLPPVTVQNYPTSPEINQEIGGTRPTNFDSDAAELKRLIAEFTDEKSDFTKWSHPFFGKLSRWEWSRWAYVHINHHLRQFGA